MDIYIVRYLDTIVGASAKLQGAEVIKADWIAQQAKDGYPAVSPLIHPDDRQLVVEATTCIENHELQDAD